MLDFVEGWKGRKGFRGNGGSQMFLGDSQSNLRRGAKGEKKGGDGFSLRKAGGEAEKSGSIFERMGR